MSFSLTLVHAPGSLGPQQWDSLQSWAPGPEPNEAQLRVDVGGSHVEASGAQLAEALRSLPELDGAALICAGRHLERLEAGSVHIHPGMVVVAGDAPGSAPGAHGQLAVSVETGPDAGQLRPLTRGEHTIGRGHADLRIADLAVSREEGTLDVGRTAVRFVHDGGERRLTTQDTLELGSSTLRLVRSAPDQPSALAWPPAPAVIEEKPPEGKHRMMLAMACIPLVIGLVMVAVTGMWFFLLFSAASALVAAAVVLDAGRRGRRYRRAVRDAAAEWAARTESLPSPGILAQLLGEDPALQLVHAGGTHVPGATAADQVPPLCPAVRLGVAVTRACAETASVSTDLPAELLETPAVAALPLRAGEVTVLRGPERDVERCLRWLLLQLLLGSSRVPVVVTAEAFLAGLPACAEDAAGLKILRRAGSLGDGLEGGPGILLAERLDSAQVRAVRECGWHVVLRHASQLAGPVGEADLEAGTITRREGSRGAAEFWGLRFDGLSAETFEALLRRGLPHSWAGSTAQGHVPPRCVTRLPQPPFPDRAAESLIADLGRGRDGPVLLDLVADGPHLLLGGTTGSGKSELLKTLTLSLAGRYGPEELNFVLFDFKGGATFHQLNQLEHSLGLITDLSQAQAERTLESIRSELVRREKLFLEADAGDYGEYRRARPDRPLARILVVIDEFRIFSHELPGTMDELMRIATLGRSLGLHLVLSTQRPQGVVTADIRANIGATIALRVRTEEDSTELIGSPEAGSITSSLPGRALLRRGGAPAEEFQTAQTSGPEQKLSAVPAAAPAAHAPAGTPVRSIVARLNAQLTAAGRHRRHTPLTPPLPESLSAEYEEAAAQLGLIDLPLEQHQRPLSLNPARPQTAGIAGEPDAGGSRALAAAARQLAGHRSGPELHLLDGDNSLNGLSGHPAVASLLTPETLPEAERLISELRTEMNARRLLGKEDAAPVVLILTGYSQWHAALQSSPAEHDLLTLAGEGPAAGLSVLVSGGRELAMGKLGGRLSTAIYLPFGASEDIRYVWPKLRRVDSLPGRGVVIDPATPSPGLEVQLVHDVGAIPAPAPRTRPPAVRVRPLPERLSSSDLKDPEADDDALTVGVEQFSLAPAQLRLGPVNLVVGSPSTGKTSALRLLENRIPGSILLSGGTDWQLPAQPGALLVDDAHRCTPEQHAALQRASAAGTVIVASALPSPAVFSHLPWSHPARTQGANLLLSPVHRSEADAFAMMVPVLPRPIPGRAVHLRPEGPRIIQVAHREDLLSG
ncbi:FtsK/SpoIIIE domain-containing protein [Nesterenkonia populi]